jgi:hypothetical protein
MICLFVLLALSSASSSFDDKVTLIIKTHERPASVNQLVKSIRQFYPRVPVLVADDGELSQKFKTRCALIHGLRSYFSSFTS